MNKVVMVSLGVLTLSAAVEKAGAAPTDCGATINQVNQILEVKYPSLGSKFTRSFLGTWQFRGQLVSITSNRKINVMGWNIVICPRDDRKFDVYWESDGSKAGILGRSGSNIVIYQTKMGDLTLTRAEESVAAD